MYLRSWIKDNKKFLSYFKEEKRQDYSFSSKFAYRLYGVPVGVKDIFNTLSMPTQFGSKIYKNHEAGNDARVVSNISREGSIIAGKTTTKFAVHHPSMTKNPFDYALSPGTFKRTCSSCITYDTNSYF